MYLAEKNMNLISYIVNFFFCRETMTMLSLLSCLVLRLTLLCENIFSHCRSYFSGHLHSLFVSILPRNLHFLAESSEII